MILGIGVDLVDVERIDRAIERHGEHFLHRVFTKNEIAYCAGMRAPGPHYAARFAAKEAVSKAFGTGIGERLGFQEIEVCREESGAPFIVLRGAAGEFARERGVQKIHLALSHTATHAVAQVVIEGADVNSGGSQGSDKGELNAGSEDRLVNGGKSAHVPPLGTEH